MEERQHRKRRLTPEQKWQVFLEASRKNATDAEVCRRGSRADKPTPARYAGAPAFLAGGGCSGEHAGLDVPESTVYRWVRQDRIDRGELAGILTGEGAELRAAKRRIAELESELAIVKRASALFAEGRVVRPTTVRSRPRTLHHTTKRSTPRSTRTRGFAP